MFLKQRCVFILKGQNVSAYNKWPEKESGFVKKCAANVAHKLKKKQKKKENKLKCPF